MDYLQYVLKLWETVCDRLCFKPYYKWITFNTLHKISLPYLPPKVLNLIINGLPSIPVNFFLKRVTTVFEF